MKLSHLAAAIAIIIAVIVAAIITAFSVVTFDSLDKAVRNSMDSESEVIRSSLLNLIQRTVQPASNARRQLLSRGLTFRTQMPVLTPGTYDTGMYVSEIARSNLTNIWEIMMSLCLSYRDVVLFAYFTGKSTLDNQTWGGLGSYIDSTRQVIYASDLRSSVILFNGSSFGNFDFTSILTYPATSNGAIWQLQIAALTASDAETGMFSALGSWTDPYSNTRLLWTYSLPMDMNESSGNAISGFSIDINTESLNKALDKLATKNNMLFIIDARKTAYYDGALVASSISLSELPVFDRVKKTTFAPGKTPNAKANGIMNRILDEYPGGFSGMANSKMDVVVPNYDGYVLLAAHVYAPGNFHCVIISAVPRSYYYGSTIATIGGTIGGGVALLIAACVIIVYIMLEQQKLVEGARQSVEIADEVAKNLVLYNTDDAAIVIEKALRPTLQFAVDGETREEINYANRDLVLALQQINENLTIYKPHLPEYVLPSSTFDAEALEAMHVSRKESCEQSQMSELRTARSIDIIDDAKNPNTKNLVSRSKKSTTGKEDARSNNPDTNDTSYIVLTEFNKGGTRHHLDDRSEATCVSRGQVRENIVPVAKLALMRHSGDVVERVVFANLNMSRANDLLFPSVLTVAKATTIRNVNKMIENILETATANDATVHCMVGDNICVSWNATSRVVHADVKAMRFVTTVDSLIKKDLHALYLEQNPDGANKSLTDKVNTSGQQLIQTQQSQQPQQQQHLLSPYLDPYRSILSGGVVNGSAWCQLGGNSKRQQFTLLNFSESKLLTTVTETGNKGNLVAVCRTVYQNCQHEFVFRGCGIHCLPGNEKILFPGTANLSRSLVTGSATPRPQPATPDASMYANAGGANNLNNNINNNNNNPINLVTTTTKGRTMLASPVYELCSRKNVSAADEWLYVVGDNLDASGEIRSPTFSREERDKSILKEQQHQEQLAGIFNVLVLDVARGNVEAATKAFQSISEYDPEAQFLSAYQNLSRIVRKMSCC